MENSYLITRTANETLEYAKTLPTPKMLFSEFWIEGELCVLFADTNNGKSTLAMNMADSISKGIPMDNFILDKPAQKVICFDFELSEKQFQNRYSDDYTNMYKFSDNLIRASINYDYEGQMSLENIRQSIEETIIKHDAKVVIIDNITFLIEDNEKAKEATPFMKGLKSLKQKLGISILLIAHTPKRDKTRPIDDTDLQGSRMIANFMDSSFAIGTSSTNTNKKYFKQLKARSVEKTYGTENVVVCTLQKDLNYLRFVYSHHASEYDLIKLPTPEDKQEEIARVLELKSRGMSYRKIGKELGISHMKAKRICEKNRV